MLTLVSTERKTKKADKRFLASYFHDGAWWGIDFYAGDWADAQTRCNKLSLRLDGEHMLTIPAVGGYWLPNLICWVRNALAKPKESN